MTFYVSKTLVFLISPFNLILFGFFLGFIFSLINYKFWSKFFYICSITFFLFISIFPLGAYFNYLLEKNFHNKNYYPENVDGILILGGATNPYLTKEHNQISLNNNSERLFESILLIKKYPRAKVIFSGGSGSLRFPELDHASVVKNFFNKMSIENKNIYYEDKSRNTYENILFSKTIVNPKKNETWLLVTSAFHLKRSLAIADKIEWTLTPFAVDFSSSKKFSWKPTFNPLGNLNSLEKSSHEIIGLAAYYLLGRTNKFF